MTVTAETTGVIREVAFQEGARVNEGDVLVVLDSAEAEAELKAVRAEAEEIGQALARST